MLVSMPVANGPPGGAVWAPAAFAVRPTTTPSTVAAVMVPIPIDRGFMRRLLSACVGGVPMARSSAHRAVGGKAGAAEAAEAEPVREAVGAVLGRRRGQRLRGVGEHDLFARAQPALDLRPGLTDGTDRHRDPSRAATVPHL